MNTIKIWCTCLRIFFQILTFLFPVFLIVFWAIPETIIDFINYIPIIIPIDHYTVHQWHFSTKILGAMLSFIPGGFTIFMFYKLSRLFKLYEQGLFLEPKNFRIIRKIAIAMLIKEILFPFYVYVLYIVLTKDFPSERHFLPVDMNNANFTVIFTACLIIVITKFILVAVKTQNQDQSNLIKSY